MVDIKKKRKGKRKKKEKKDKRKKTMSFESQWQTWVTLDDRIKQLNDELRELRDEKSTIGHSILEYVDAHQLQDRPIVLPDGMLKFGMVKETASLTYTYLEKCLHEIIPNEEQVDQIISYVKTQREVKLVPEIKRSYQSKGKTNVFVEDEPPSSTNKEGNKESKKRTRT